MSSVARAALRGHMTGMIGPVTMAGRAARAATLGSLALALVAPAAAARPAKKPARPVPDLAFGAFTPAAADPRLAAAFARSGLGTANFAGGAFRFTPSGSSASQRAVTVAVRARSVTKAESARALAVATDVAPSAYSLGMSLGWRRFTISGDIARTDAGLLPESRESADIGVGFRGHRWATKLDLAADRALGDRPQLLGIDQSWSVGLGGSYALTRNLDLSGGIRYKTQEIDSLQENRRDSQAVYLGTTFRF